MNADSAGSTRALLNAWAASGRVFAVSVASLVALISLMSNAPLHVASLRGAIALAAVRALTAAGQWLVPRVTQDPEADSADPDVTGAQEAANG